MSFSFLPVTALSLPVFLGATIFGAAPATPAAQFEVKDTLPRPEGYRECVFVGRSLGLGYDEGKKEPQQLEYKNVYVDPAAYRAYAWSCFGAAFRHLLVRQRKPSAEGGVG